ncbi:Putative SOS response-associated peptidase YedK [Arthrobacter woluwensis]|uniref:Abasic site processing protein n=2 Tax=Arthrobacter woluwensis TaxID=156980 RepID=A0A1H4I4N4_9MICC|nr:Putative SOS response-associated peptidase YedK [Arthrobacter woluwensis]SEC79937.1 Putative SOS response-associated peptidase YedK [Arthrobacter woluwensis]
MSYDGGEISTILRSELDAQWSGLYSMSPGVRGPFVAERADNNGTHARALVTGTWGIQGAAWGKPEIKSINARSDNLFRVAKWRELYRAGKTALVPMNGYVEFVETSPKYKVPVFIHDNTTPLLTAAGLYDEEQGAYTIITMEADLGAGEVHTRQPIFVPEDMQDRWLQVGAGDTPGKGATDKHKETLAELRDFSSEVTERLEYYAISRDYNNTRKLAADDRRADPSLIEPDPEMQHIIDTADFEPALSPKERKAQR